MTVLTTSAPYLTPPAASPAISRAVFSVRQKARHACDAAFVRLIQVVIPDARTAEAVYKYHAAELQELRKHKKSQRSLRKPHTCCEQPAKYTTRLEAPSTDKAAAARSNAASNGCTTTSNTASNGCTTSATELTQELVTPQRPRSNTFPLSRREQKARGLSLTIDASEGFTSTPKLMRAESDDFNAVIDEFKTVMGSLREQRREKQQQTECNPYATSAPAVIQQERQLLARRRYWSAVVDPRGISVRATSLDDDDDR